MGWSRFFRRRRWDEERARELEDYLAHEIDDNLARGMTPDEARRAAYRRLGNPTLIREEIYRMNTIHLLDSVWQDLRFGVRLVLTHRTFAAVAILTLALGTGANAAIFQLVHAVRLRTLPVERPQELVSIGIDTRDGSRTGSFTGRRPYFTEPLWQALQTQQQGFASIFAWGPTRWNTATDGSYQPVEGLYVSGSFFTSLGITPAVGRLIAPSDDHTGCSTPGAVITHGFWQSRFGGDPAVVGRPLTLDGRPLEIIGVAPAGFFGAEVGRSFDAAVPLCAEPLIRGAQSAIGRTDYWWLDIMGRLRPGWTVERAQGQLQSISAGIFGTTVPAVYTADRANEYAAFHFTARSAPTGVSSVRRAYATQLWVLLGATGLVLLITCANLANLMLARASAREREIAVRLAIGASRWRLIRQMLAESLVLAALGALGGVLLAQWLSRALVTFLSTDGARLFVDLTPDWPLFAFIAMLAVLACLFFGLTPALRATGTDPGGALQSGGRSSTDGRQRLGARRGLVVMQVALSTVLIVTALLFARSLQNLVTLDPGFRQDGLLTARVDLQRAGVDPATRRTVYGRILDRLRAVPGVNSVAVADVVAMSGSVWNHRVIVGGEKQEGIVDFNRVGAEYFSVMETPLLAGRMFSAQDRLESPPVAIVNEAFARTYLAGGNPIGQRLQIDGSPEESLLVYEIVGLVRDAKTGAMRDAFTPTAYLATTQEPGFASPALDLVLRAALPAASIAPALTQAIRDVAPGATVSHDTIARYIRDSLVTERLLASLSGFFGILALLIATIGLYGLMSYLVSRRQAEIGIRMALGADPGQMQRMVLGDSGRLLVIGVAFGTVFALVATRSAAALLFELKPWDPFSIVVAVAMLALTGSAAAWIPARRASRVAPTVALRAE